MKFLGAPLVATTSAAGGINVGAAITVTANDAVTFNANSSGLLTNAGTIQTTNPALTLNVNGGTLTNTGTVKTTANNGSLLFNTGLITVGGTGFFVVAPSGSPSSPSIVLQSASGSALNINETLKFDSGASGTVTFKSLGLACAITLGASADPTIQSGSALTVSSTVVNFSSLSRIDGTGQSSFLFNSGRRRAGRRPRAGRSTATRP